MKWIVYLYITACGFSCQTLLPKQKQQIFPITAWNGKIYVGDSKRLGVSRSPKEDPVLCKDQAFDRMVCMSLEDYTALMQYFLQAACTNE